MRAHAIKACCYRVGAAVRTYLTSRWWMPPVLYCIAVAGVWVVIVQILRWTRVVE